MCYLQSKKECLVWFLCLSAYIMAQIIAQYMQSWADVVGRFQFG